MKRYSIGLLLDNLYGIGSYQNQVWRGVSEVAAEENANFFCFAGGTLENSPENKFEKHRNIIYSFIDNNNVDGILFTGLTLGNYIPQSEFLSFCKSYSPLPMVSIGGPIPRYPCVLINNEEGLYQVLKHLIEVHSYKNIAFIRGPQNNEDAKQRYNVYKKLLNEYNIPLDQELVVTGNFVTESGIQAVKELLDVRKKSFEVIVASNDNMALGAIHELKNRGIRVPYDVAITGFDNIEEAEANSLTTVEQPVLQQARNAAQLLLKKIRGESIEQQILPTTPIFRESCGCVLERVSRAHFLIGQNTETKINRKRHEIIPDILQQASRILNFNKNDSMYSDLENMIKSFFNELDTEKKKEFLSKLDKLIMKFIKDGIPISSLQDILSLIRQMSLPNISEHDLYSRVENLIQQARVLISEKDIIYHNEKLINTRELNVIMDGVGRALSSSFQIKELLDIIEDQLPRIGIKTCYISFFMHGHNNNFEKCRLVFCFENSQRKQIDKDNSVYESKLLIPPQGSMHNELKIFIFPLYFQENYIGMLLMEGESNDGLIYESIFVKLCNALQGSLILQKNNQVQQNLVQRNKKIQELIEPMIESIKNVAQICTEKMKSIKAITESSTDSWTKISQTNQSIAAAALKMEKMIELIKIIDDISIKVNLVAFNASIEATHVGKHGKGFSIIAKEIRKLSDSTKKNADQISKALNDTAQSIQSSVEVVKKSQSSFTDLGKGIDELLNSFRTISEKMNELSIGNESLLNMMEKQK